MATTKAYALGRLGNKLSVNGTDVDIGGKIKTEISAPAITIDAANTGGKTPVGDELFPNGGLENAIANGWSKTSEVSFISSKHGDNTVANILSTDGSMPYIEKAVTLTAGNSYLIQYNLVRYKSGTPRIHYSAPGSGGSAIASPDHTTTLGTKSYSFTATEAGTYYMRVSRSGSTCDFDIDNISLKEVATKNTASLKLQGHVDIGDTISSLSISNNDTEFASINTVRQGTTAGDTTIATTGKLILNGQTGITIDCNNVTNQPVLNLSDMGAGHTGIKLRRATAGGQPTGGYIMYGQSIDHSRPLAIHGTNKSLGYRVSGNGGNASYAAHDFAIDANASNTHPAVMAVRSPNNNALLFQGEQSDSTVVFSVDYDGNVATSGTVDGVDIAARDAVLTSTTTTANDALPKTGGTITGDVTATTVNATTVDLGDWTITEASGSLLFATQGVTKMKLDSSGNLDVVGNINSSAYIPSPDAVVAYNADGLIVNGKNPALAFDFVNGYYRNSGVASTFSNSVTHARAGHATMVDSDGLLKWAPHNILPRSEELNRWSQAGAGSIVVDNAVAPDGTTTAATLTISSLNLHRYILSSATYTAGDKITFSFWVRSDTVTTLPFGINGGTNGANNYIFSDVAVTSTWQLVEFEFTVLGSDASLYYIIGKQNTNPTNCQLGDVEIWHLHTYRSDLGGMVNNSATGNSYVPTTSSPVYAPRVGHHVYNGTAWVNEGILHESEARTNLAYPSDISGGSWAGEIWANTTRADWNGIPNGAVRINTNATGTGNRIYNLSFATSGAGTHCLSFYYKSGSTVPFLHVRYNTSPDIIGVCINTSNDVLTTGHYDGTVVSTAFLTQGVVDVGGGWRRFYGTLSENDNSRGHALLFYLSTSATTTSTSFGSVETIDLAGVQYEQGSTPSSYIPTSGSTVTRAAETLTVPAANLPYPTPVETTGTELVTNGTFDSNTNNWTAFNSALSVDSNRLKIVNDGIFGSATHQFTTVSGKLYLVTADLIHGGAVDGRILINEGQFGGALYNSLDAMASFDKTYSIVFKAVSHLTNIVLQNSFGTSGGLGSTGDFNFWDNVSIKEINPLALSIQMDGKMTYAEDGGNNTALPWRWRLDSSNILYNTISTAGTRTGQPRFIQQQATSGYDEVIGANNVYSPNINVPFNFAGRYGSTFINGAHEGTLLTANTTPTALPNLSSANLELGYIFMGTIGQFRVWDEDIGDTGIASASL